MDEIQEEENGKKEQEDDVMTWTGKKLGEVKKKPGHLLATTKRNVAGQESLIVDTLEEQEPVKKKPKAGGFGNFSGW